jgi:heme-degrading monooxygenase HmoA
VLLRVFRARIFPGREPDFARWLVEEATPMMDGQPGVRDYWIGYPEEGSTEFAFVSVWEDLDSLVAVRGEGWREAEIFPEEVDIVAEAWVHHYELPDRAQIAGAGA